jgi:hypothetical protein
MEFSYKKNELLSLQKRQGNEWVKSLKLSDTLKILFKPHTEAGKPLDCLTQADILLDELLYKKPFKNIHFCSSMYDMANKMDGKKSYQAFRAIENDYGVIFFDNIVSLIYGIYKDRAVFILLEGCNVLNIELIRYIDDNDKYSYSAASLHLQQLMSKLGKDIKDDDIDELNRPMFERIMPLLTIYHFAEIENRVIEQGKTRKAVLGKEKFINETQLPIQVINSNWFTNIYRSEGFNVNGHFRLQACGEGHAKRKLIWINGFEKQGYTRMAKMNQDNPQNN